MDNRDKQEEAEKEKEKEEDRKKRGRREWKRKERVNIYIQRERGMYSDMDVNGCVKEKESMNEKARRNICS